MMSSHSDTSPACTNAVSFVDGEGLHLPVTKMSTPSGRPYCAAVLSTKDSGLRWIGGTFTVRACFEIEKGIWPALWMLADGSGKQHEIDGMEAYGIGHNATIPAGGYEGALHNTVQRLALRQIAGGADTACHDYGWAWRPGNYLAWTLDGVEKARVSQAQAPIPGMAMSLILDNKIGSFHAAPDGSTPDVIDLVVQTVTVTP